MLKFICKEVRTCPEGALTGQEMKTFDDVWEMEKWLRQYDGGTRYVERSLVGCEKVNEPETTEKPL